MPLKGKIAIVTGGSRGIGSVICKRLCREGSKVVLTYLTGQESADKVAESISKEGGQCITCRVDVRLRSEVKASVSTALEAFGGLDILVNNAGINKPTDFDQVTDEDFDDVIAVNLKGPFICCQEVLDPMRKRGGGNIVNIGSVSGQYGGPRTIHYATSKAGLISLGQVVARFGAKDNIRCNTIAAGLIDSEMAASGMKAGTVATLAENIPLRRLGTAEEIADAVVFLVSDRSSYVTAQTINVNGGIYF